MDLTDRRLSAQGLAGSDLTSAEAAVERLLAVQGQDGRGARLAIRSRLADSVEEPTAALVDEALNDGRLVVGWVNRGTLHLVRSEDYRWLHAITGPRMKTSNQTRLRQEGVSEAQAEKAVKLIVKALADGPVTRPVLRDRLKAAGIPVEGQAMVHILYLASIRSLIVRGPMVGREQAFVLFRDWLGEPLRFDPAVHLPELARRYLAGHGPASDRDLAAWAGIPLGQARKGLSLVAGEIEELEEPDAAGETLVDLKSRTGPSGSLPVRLLGNFDPVLHGWASREWIIPEAARRGVVTVNGLFRPTILYGRRIIGTWSLRAGEIELAPFEELDSRTAAALDREIENVASYLAVDR